jgi:hypothetical protein
MAAVLADLVRGKLVICRLRGLERYVGLWSPVSLAGLNPEKGTSTPRWYHADPSTTPVIKILRDMEGEMRRAVDRLVPRT